MFPSSLSQWVYSISSVCGLNIPVCATVTGMASRWSWGWRGMDDVPGLGTVPDCERAEIGTLVGNPPGGLAASLLGKSSLRSGVLATLDVVGPEEGDRIWRIGNVGAAGACWVGPGREVTGNSDLEPCLTGACTGLKRATTSVGSTRGGLR